jgi:hypothetical protein
MRQTTAIHYDLDTERLVGYADNYGDGPYPVLEITDTDGRQVNIYPRDLDSAAALVAALTDAIKAVEAALADPSAPLGRNYVTTD